MDAAENIRNISGPASEGGERCGERWEVVFPCWQTQKKSFKMMKAKACLLLTHTHAHTQRADYTCATHYTHVPTLEE